MSEPIPFHRQVQETAALNSLEGLRELEAEKRREIERSATPPSKADIREHEKYQLAIAKLERAES